MHISKSIINNIKANINNKMTLLKKASIKTLAFSLCIVLLDQISKLMVLKIIGFEKSKNFIPNLLNFTVVKNEGAAFSLFSNSTSILTFISILSSILLITFILKKPPISLWNLNALAFLLGGTLGNGIDRLLKGHVVDFLEIVPVNFPIFNIADISINIAIVFFIIDIVKIKSKSRL